jgi:flagellar assembly factor FliW
MTLTTTSGRSRPDTASSPELIRIPDGLLGFPDTTAYRLADGPSEGLYWLVGLDSNDPTFLVGDPFVFFDGYRVDLSPDQARRVSADELSQIAVLTITVPGAGKDPWTANTQGPIVINVEKSLGAQLVLTDQNDGLRRPFRPEIRTDPIAEPT